MVIALWAPNHSVAEYFILWISDCIRMTEKSIARALLMTGLLCTLFCYCGRAQDIGIWMRFEKAFVSAKEYNNALHDARLTVTFTSPTGRAQSVSGFWDGGSVWRVRFMPDERGMWTWTTLCSDKTNAGLNDQRGSFECTGHNNLSPLYSKGAITRASGLYHLEHADGTPFFWAACTAWNGTLKSTDEEWKLYLDNRVSNHYNVIQFVTTQWRGGDRNSLGQVAFEGSGIISVNPEFFQRLDKKLDQINDAGLVAAPVLLWALQSGPGRDLSPGYYLPDQEAILLAKYMVARYGAHHVVWILGGDGRYTDQFEHRWKQIGRGVFGDEHPGLVALHPGGKSWIGEVYRDEEWLDIVGYQSGHDDSERTIKWITQGPVVTGWKKSPPKIFINMEPVYEEIRQGIGADAVRRASYWSILATPTAGITYGANGIWPWLREGEEILNHASSGGHVSRWRESLQLPGSIQVGYLSKFLQGLEWWKLKPAQELLVQQPGDSVANNFVSVSRSDDRKTTVVYVPSGEEIYLYSPDEGRHEGKWFDPVADTFKKASLSTKKGVMRVTVPKSKNDLVLVLTRTF